MESGAPPSQPGCHESVLMSREGLLPGPSLSAPRAGTFSSSPSTFAYTSEGIPMVDLPFSCPPF